MDYNNGGGHQQMKKPTVLLLPWLGHGHITPYLELAKHLSTRNFNVYLCSTPTNLNPLKPKLQNSSTTITLIELHLPSTPQLPPHYHTTNGLPPHLMPHLKSAFDSPATRTSFSSVLISVSPDLLIYDFLQPWAPELASSLLHIPAVLFVCPSAAMSSYAAHCGKFGYDDNSRVPFPFSGSVYLRDGYEKRAFVSTLMESACANGINDQTRVQLCQERSHGIVLIKTFREIEGKYVDYLSKLYGKRYVPVGPLLHKTPPPSDSDDKDARILKWLDAKQTSSTVFVSFGTECFLPPNLIHEIAHGLELSGANFVWVMRFPLEDQNTRPQSPAKALPPGFQDRVGEKGLVVEGWAPQSAILAHGSVGGFVSHCGWSSVMESMWYGVPIVAMPMQLDQPLNARLVEEVGVGVEVKRDWRSGKVDRKEVGKVIREVVMGEKVRRKAKEMSEVMKKKGDLEIDDVVRELLQLCRSTNVNYN